MDVVILIIRLATAVAGLLRETVAFVRSLGAHNKEGR